MGKFYLTQRMIFRTISHLSVSLLLKPKWLEGSGFAWRQAKGENSASSFGQLRQSWLILQRLVKRGLNQSFTGNLGSLWRSNSKHSNIITLSQNGILYSNKERTINSLEWAIKRNKWKRYSYLLLGKNTFQ